MRIVTWNCGAGFHRKYAALQSLAPDVAIVQECAELATLAFKTPGFAPSSALWTGDNPHKGLGVFSFGPYKLTNCGVDDRSITYALGARVTGPHAFNLVGLWAHYGKSPLRVSSPGPTLLALQNYAHLLTEQPAIMAGDLNNHVRWDRPRKASNHATAVAASAALGMASAYHAFHGIEQGAERHPTLYWRDRAKSGPTYHIDYVFVPRTATRLVQRVKVGSYAKWIGTGLSDHAPMIVDFFPEFAESKQSLVSSAAR